MKTHLFFISFFICSCTYDELTECEVQSPSFETCVLPIIQDNCISCHSYGGNSETSLYLTSHNDIVNAIEDYNLLERINLQDGAVMPPTGKMSLSNLEIIDRWVNSGKQNN